MNRRQFLHRSALTLIASSMASCLGQDKIQLSKNQVIGFFGDSITYAGGKGYVEILQARLNQEHPELNLKLLNYGQSSETVTGLTETDHPGPRPYLFERLDTLLDKTALDMAFFCYGINDGIYGLPSEKLFNSFKIGVYSFLEKMRQRNIDTVLMTPPPLALEAAPLSNLDTKKDYGYKNPYPKYEEEVLQEFRRIILEMQHPLSKIEIDIHSPLLKSQMDCYDTDPIHPNGNGHQLIADTIYQNFTF